MAESRIRSFPSKPRGEWFIAAGGFAFVLAELTRQFLPAVDPMTTIKTEFSAVFFIHKGHSGTGDFSQSSQSGSRPGRGRSVIWIGTKKRRYVKVLCLRKNNLTGT